MRIIFVPQFPSKLRYQEFWYKQFPIEFKKRGFEVITLGENYLQKIKNERCEYKENFSPIKESILLETVQVNEYIDLDIKEDDILFLADISFPGIFCNALYHKSCSKMFAFCHATSLNNFDYFQNMRHSKFKVECSHSILFDKVFVGSNYHQQKLLLGDKLNTYWNNTLVTYLPFPSVDVKITGKNKTIDIMSASRPTPQKVDFELENKVEKTFNLKIQRPVAKSWINYYWNLSSSKILLITAHEDTFGYQIVDAILNNCIPLARNSFAYPELLPREYLYNDEDELLHKIDYILNAGFNYLIPKVPNLLCQEQMNKFYDTICEEMTK